MIFDPLALLLDAHDLCFVSPLGATELLEAPKRQAAPPPSLSLRTPTSTLPYINIYEFSLYINIICIAGFNR